MFEKFGLALLLGFLIGLEREKEKGGVFAGVRTFTLLSLLGCVCGLVGDLTVTWFFAVAFAVAAAFILTGYHRMAPELPHPGTTTEAAAFLTFLYGGLVWWGYFVPAIALTVMTILMLATKKPLVRLTEKLARDDVMAAIQFGLISAVILPLLPDRTFDPLRALNPFRIWLMVVLIAGLNLAAYAAIKALGSKRGIGVMSLLGGLLSTTVLTVTFARRSRQQPEAGNHFAAGLCLAIALLFLRVLALLLVVAPSLGRTLVASLLLGAAVSLLVWLAMWAWNRKHLPDSKEISLDVRNPFELWPALEFGLLFAAILLFSRGAESWFGSAGTMVSGLIGGCASVDAAILSMAALAKAVDQKIAADGVMLALAGSMMAKSLILIVLADSGMKRLALPAILVILAGILAGMMMI